MPFAEDDIRKWELTFYEFVKIQHDFSKQTIVIRWYIPFNNSHLEFS